MFAIKKHISDRSPSMARKRGFMYKCILFDFSKTLCSNIYFESLPEKERQIITEVLFTPDGYKRFEKDWLLGRISFEEVLTELSIHLPYSTIELEHIFKTDYGKFSFNEPIYSFSQEVRKYCKTAIVTLNHDIFSRYLVPEFNLNEKFDYILNSADYGTLNKIEMIAKVSNFKFSEMLLIDDSIENGKQFKEAGGSAILYNNETFSEKAESLLNKFRSIVHPCTFEAATE